MSSIREAKFIDMKERNDEKFVDIDVWLTGREEPLRTVFKWNDGRPELETVYALDTSVALDWFENNLHKAYVDLTAEMFDNGRGELGLGSREDFTEEVLAQPDVRHALMPYLQPGRNSTVDEVAFLTTEGELKEHSRH
ncbi:hypothetical protein ACFFK0_23555 [Paenibacillus chartarius]|uniref:Uncharacterized protein n=1 Tax=Paenibacillus chartarius TaxID=747481 RepID=A0ABV6DRU8_9BACL